METIQDKDECKTAAESLKIQVSSVSTFLSDRMKRPYGCIYGSNDLLQLFSGDKAQYTSAACGSRDEYYDSYDHSTYDCICRGKGKFLKSYLSHYEKCDSIKYALW